MNITVGAPRARRRNKGLWWIAGALAGFAFIVLSLLSYTLLPALLAYAKYHPQEGDVIFQSLPFSPLVNAIEGATKSPYSHCGIVALEDGRWVVYEAHRPVGPTPLREYVFRGRHSAFAVYRLKPEQQAHVPAMLAKVHSYRGRPYDERYRLDDKAAAIYCSELIYLAYRDATGGEELGQLVTLGDLQWQPYNDLIQRIENGPPPLDRQIITPRDLARAEQLEPVYQFGYGR
ncbi:YiiX/YebB-like N1pC/P60 family cysteine hydrolase [Anatilimnocola sp. NA78]|uniref:YiiX/YebB-like N1pC/P60 family cysteine hydrolase n=1 Tax=Anatilimnocola sp. NA78 TaxID=3415683 RepID=UPI003CE4B6C9